MFSFTTQTVYNQISTTGANKNLIDNSGASKVPSLRIGNTRFDAATITSIQIKAPSAEQLGSVAFDMNDVIPSTGETTGRIAIYLGLSMGSQDSFYSNALVYKGKPIVQGTGGPESILINNGTEVQEASLREKGAEIRYGNRSEVRIEIRYGTDDSIFELSDVYIDYLKTP